MAEIDIAALPRSLEEARRVGSRHYFTRKPCCRGHTTARFVSTRGCVECARENLAASRTDDERWRRYWMAYKERNRDAVNAGYRGRYAANSEKFREKTRDYRRRNPEAARVTTANARARRMGADGTITIDDVRAAAAAQEGKYPYCRRPFGLRYHVDHKKALAAGGPNSADNIQICCPRCNIFKGGMGHDEFVALIAS